MIKIENLNKNYGNKEILKDINFEFKEGKVYGLLGKNGVGKTTLLKILSNKIIRYSGEISYYNEPIRENRDVLKNICYSSSDMKIDLEVKEIINVYKHLYEDFDKERFENLLAEFHINKSIKDLNELSKGNRIMFNIIIGLCTNAKVLLFDEPTEGLDAINANEFYKLIQQIDLQDRILIISSHSIDELEKHITDIVILDDKNLVVGESMDEFYEKSVILSTNSNVKPDLKVISEENLGDLKIYYIYDDSEKIKKELEKGNYKESVLSLKKFFINLINKKVD